MVPDQARMTTFSVNYHYPIVAVCDTMGVVRIYKLSPNLRKASVFVQPKQKGNVQQMTLEEIKKKEAEMELQKI